MGCRSRRSGVCLSGSARRWGLKAGVGRRGTVPRLSGDQVRQAVEDDAKDRLIGGARRQVDLDLLFQFDDAGGDLDEAQPQSVELHDARRSPSSTRVRLHWPPQRNYCYLLGAR